MFTILIVFQVLLAIGLVAIVLVQRGPGATMGAAFGSGASGTVFGSRGAGNFLTRTTAWLATAFFAISLALAVLAARTAQDSDQTLGGSVFDQAAAESEAAADPDPVLQALDEVSGTSGAGDTGSVDAEAVDPEAGTDESEGGSAVPGADDGDPVDG